MDQQKEVLPTFDFENLEVFKNDHYLKNYKYDFKLRLEQFTNLAQQIINNEGGLVNFAMTYKKFGFIIQEDGIYFREWLPAAHEAYLFGEFNNWDRKQYKMVKNDFGVFEIFLPKDDITGKHLIQHNTKLKLHILDANHQWKDKIPSRITYVVQPENQKHYEAVFWNPEEKFQFKNTKPQKPLNLKIYEAHVGMAGIEPQVHTYKNFTQNVLPRIKKLGYNCVQLMAIMEHAYYGSFGYHVTNFFAISSRSGTPEELKELVDTAHGMGIYVLMDLVHSHASSNVDDGINQLDGSQSHYFHEGSKGRHELWDSRLFNYNNWEVLRFLLSNLAFYQEEYQFDGFRFDGITSMLYHHHGLGTGFTGNYNEYFSLATDLDAAVYLMLANYVIHKINPDAITIAEDVSGFPSLGSPIECGGIGFDYRLAMAIPDYWIKLLKEFQDDQWDMAALSWTLINRRYDEKVIAYCESHDQALVGDKTILMWLLDKEIYFEMTTLKPETLLVHRGISLHKMIRLITLALGGDGYLCFMGNEFGHPEWIDFPREGNGWSYQHCRRRWDLADDKLLRYHYLLNFDEAMINLEDQYKWLSKKDNFVSENHQSDKIIVFERGPLVFVFNFHPTKSFDNYRIGTQFPYNHKMVLNTDEPEFGGHSRLNKDTIYPILKETWHNRNNHIQIYIPSRTAIVFEPMFE